MALVVNSNFRAPHFPVQNLPVYHLSREVEQRIAQELEEDDGRSSVPHMRCLQLVSPFRSSINLINKFVLHLASSVYLAAIEIASS
jgi:hypothetical protein